MVSKFRLAVLILPIVIGSIVLAFGYNKHLQATAPIDVKETPIYGILPFSSIECEIKYLDTMIWIDDVQKNEIKFFFPFYVSVTSPLDEEASLEKQIFGVQIPFSSALETGTVEAEAWSEPLDPRAREGIPVEIVDLDVEMKGDVSIIYLIFMPLPEMSYYRFEIAIHCEDAIIRETFSTHVLYVPLATSENNVFDEYFLDLGYSVHPIHFSYQYNLRQEFGVGLWLPPGIKVIDVFPPLVREVLKANPGNGYRSDRFLWWEPSSERLWNLGPKEHDPSSEVLKVYFEVREELDTYNQLLFESGLWIGIGVSNLIAGGYGILGYIAEKSRSTKK